MRRHAHTYHRQGVAVKLRTGGEGSALSFGEGLKELATGPGGGREEFGGHCWQRTGGVAEVRVKMRSVMGGDSMKVHHFERGVLRVVSVANHHGGITPASQCGNLRHGTRTFLFGTHTLAV